MIYKYTKCESVIAKIMADADMSEKNMRITDIREWIFEAVEKIGAPVLYIHRESGLDGCPVFRIEDCLIPIPDDLESLTAVAYSQSENGPWIPVKKNELTFKTKSHYHNHYSLTMLGPFYDKSNYTIDDPGYAVVEEFELSRYNHVPMLDMRYKMPTTKSQLYTEFNPSNAHRFGNKHFIEEPMYFIKPGWIVLNKNKGFVKLAYKAIATDERGYPLIPDLASYQEAIYWYVMMKLSFPKFLTGSLGGRSKYNFHTYSYIQQQWNFYRNLAYAEAMMPNESEMMSIKDEWNKLLPEVDQDKNFFRSGGHEQLIFNDYYYGH